MNVLQHRLGTGCQLIRGRETKILICKKVPKEAEELKLTGIKFFWMIFLKTFHEDG